MGSISSWTPSSHTTKGSWWSRQFFWWVLFFQLALTWGVRNPNLQVAITHAQHIYGELRLDFHSEWIECIERNLISCALGPSIFRNLITRVLIIYHVNLTRSTALKQKRFDLRSMSPALVITSTFFGNWVSAGYIALCSCFFFCNQEKTEGGISCSY